MCTFAKVGSNTHRGEIRKLKAFSHHMDSEGIIAIDPNSSSSDSIIPRSTQKSEAILMLYNKN